MRRVKGRGGEGRGMAYRCIGIDLPVRPIGLSSLRGVAVPSWR